jgi:hypothetical protein
MGGIRPDGLAAGAGLAMQEEQARLEMSAQEPWLEFERIGHRYTLMPDGIELPSVTTALKETRMIDYSMIPQDVLQAASRRGTAVHQALQYLDEGDLDEDSLDESLLGYIYAYAQFKRDSGFTPALIEHRVWSNTYRYAGTLDRTGTLPRQDGGEDLVVLDFKTGLVLPGHALQLAAYANCLPEPRRFRRIALKLSEDATYRVYEFPQKDFRRDLELFLHALSCCWWQRTEGKIQSKEEAA